MTFTILAKISIRVFICKSHIWYSMFHYTFRCIADYGNKLKYYSNYTFCHIVWLTMGMPKPLR